MDNNRSRKRALLWVYYGVSALDVRGIQDHKRRKLRPYSYHLSQMPHQIPLRLLVRASVYGDRVIEILLQHHCYIQVVAHRIKLSY